MEHRNISFKIDMLGVGTWRWTILPRTPWDLTLVGQVRATYQQAIAHCKAEIDVLRQTVDTIVRDFIVHERHHMMMEDRDFFPAALKALKPQGWTEIASAVTGHKDSLFSDVTEERFDALRAHILRLEQELKPNEGRLAFIRSVWLCFVASTSRSHAPRALLDEPIDDPSAKIAFDNLDLPTITEPTSPVLTMYCRRLIERSQSRA